MDDLYSVFEYTNVREGEYGIRQRIPTNQEDSFSPDIYFIVARNLSDMESLNLISETPELCWIMGSIEEASNSDGDINTGVLEGSLSNAVLAIMINRIQREKHFLQTARDVDIIDFHEYRAVGPDKKARLVAAVLDAYEHGVLDLDLMAMSFDLILNS